MCLQIIYLEYMFNEDLTLNDLQGLICHKTKPTKPNQTKPKSLHCFTSFFLPTHLSLSLSVSNRTTILSFVYMLSWKILG